MMKIKIGTILEEEIVQQLKEKSAKENRTISEIVQDALLNYFNAGPKNVELRKMALNGLCSRPFNLSGQELEEIMAEDFFQQ
jgi:hypothetical protein